MPNLDTTTVIALRCPTGVLYMADRYEDPNVAFTGRPGYGVTRGGALNRCRRGPEGRGQTVLVRRVFCSDEGLGEQEAWRAFGQDVLARTVVSASEAEILAHLSHRRIGSALSAARAAGLLS